MVPCFFCTTLYMKYLILILITIAVLFNSSASGIRAAEVYISASSEITKEGGRQYSNFGYRVNKLSNFLKEYKSPLASYADDFVYWADYYQIDWRLVPAISGVESTFGKRIPQNSFNAYGWNNGDHKFESWEDSIEEVSKTLRLKYKDNGAVTLGQIARRYAPPSSTWAWKVEFFMNKIDPTPLAFNLI
jgi:hypothetical protein